MRRDEASGGHRPRAERREGKPTSASPARFGQKAIPEAASPSAPQTEEQRVSTYLQVQNGRGRSKGTTTSGSGDNSRATGDPLEGDPSDLCLNCPHRERQPELTGTTGRPTRAERNAQSPTHILQTRSQLSGTHSPRSSSLEGRFLRHKRTVLAQVGGRSPAARYRHRSPGGRRARGDTRRGGLPTTGRPAGAAPGPPHPPRTQCRDQPRRRLGRGEEGGKTKPQASDHRVHGPNQPSTGALAAGSRVRKQ